VAKKNGSPKDVCAEQERFPTGQDGLVTNTKPTAGYVDYETEGGGEFQITTQQPGHDVFMYPSTTKGKPRD
jgi:hypothetical protein